MGQKTQAAGGCLIAAAGAGAGLAVWAADSRRRFQRFEQGPDWSVLYAELPLMVLGGTAAALGLWVLGLRPLGRRVRARR
jgi:hypothetical protein